MEGCYELGRLTLESSMESPGFSRWAETLRPHPSPCFGLFYTQEVVACFQGGEIPVIFKCEKILC